MDFTFQLVTTVSLGTGAAVDAMSLDQLLFLTGNFNMAISSPPNGAQMNSIRSSWPNPIPLPAFPVPGRVIQIIDRNNLQTSFTVKHLSASLNFYTTVSGVDFSGVLPGSSSLEQPPLGTTTTLAYDKNLDARIPYSVFPKVTSSPGIFPRVIRVVDHISESNPIVSACPLISRQSSAIGVGWGYDFDLSNVPECRNVVTLGIDIKRVIPTNESTNLPPTMGDVRSQLEVGAGASVMAKSVLTATISVPSSLVNNVGSGATEAYLFTPLGLVSQDLVLWTAPLHLASYHASRATSDSGSAPLGRAGVGIPLSRLLNGSLMQQMFSASGFVDLYHDNSVTTPTVIYGSTVSAAINPDNFTLY